MSARDAPKNPWRLKSWAERARILSRVCSPLLMCLFLLVEPDLLLRIIISYLAGADEEALYTWHALLPTSQEACPIETIVEKTHSPVPVQHCSQGEPAGYSQGPCEYLVQRSGIRRSHTLQRAVRSSLDSESEKAPIPRHPNARKDPFPE